MPQANAYFPKNLSFLNIKPQIPDNYTLVELEQMSDLGFFWAPKGVVEKILDDQKIPHVPIIHVIQLYGINSNEELKNYIEGYKKQFGHGFRTGKIKWGLHEGIAAEGYLGTYDLSCLAFICPKDSVDTCLMFQLMYSKKLDFGNGNDPSEDDLKFWKNFLMNTH